MRPHELIDILLATDAVCVTRLIEASVHLPRRGSRWVAAFRNEDGRQSWRSTGLRDRQSALALANRWEAQAKLKRALRPPPPPRPSIRVRPGSRERQLGWRTQSEVAAILGLSERGVREIERRALDKLRRHPELRELWRTLVKVD